MELTATVLGQVGLTADGTSIDLGGPRQRRLLAALLVHRGAAVPTDELVDAVFDGDPADAAWRTFRTYVARLRRALGAEGVDGSKVILTVPSGYSVADDLPLDADRFEALLGTARDHLDVGDHAAAVSTVEEALALWSGPAYGEFAGEHWARPDAVRLEELRVVAREVRVGAMVGSGRHDEAIAEIGALVESAPLREEPRRLLMLALYRSGRHAEALRAGREFGSLLAEETGLEPSKAMAELEQMVIDRDPRLDAAPRGRKLRGYVLGEVLAEAPHGTTYRASQPAVSRDVAITVIPSELADDAGFVRRFERHAQQIASIEHPNVVPLYDYWREPGGAYLVTRFMVGGSLEARLEAGASISSDDAARLVDEVGAALEAAAERGVAHGRLSAGSVLFDEAGRAHLAGFGVEEIDGSHRDVAAYAELAEVLWDRVPVPAGGDGDAAASRAAVAQVVALARSGQNGSGDVGGLHRALMSAVRGEVLRDGGTPGGSVETIEGPNPFRGLHAFGETDAEVFFGRRAIVDQLATDLRRDGFVALIGPSGSGKSSVARAGLLPVLRGSGAFVATMVPGRHPVAELEIALSRVATAAVPDLGPVLGRPDGLVPFLGEVLPDDGPLVLVLDQLEEAVTMSDPDERDVVFDALARAVRDGGGRVRIVVTARADFLGRVLEHPVIGPLVRDHSRLVTPLDSDELYEAIVEPAAAMGVAVEPELATALVADAIDSPGSLPLLQFALTELYERRVDGTMTLEAYRQMGGLAAPIAQRAEEVFGSLTVDEQAATRRLFGRLITLGEGAEDTRRRVLRSELAMVPESVLGAFGAARLLTFDRDPRTREPTVEIAHEALIRRWPRLRSWLDDDRAGLLILRHLTASAVAWDEGDRDAGELYRGSRLAAAEEWAETRRDALTPVEREFLDSSSAAQAGERHRERRRARRLRTLTAGLAIVAVIAVIAGAVAFVQRDRADQNAAEAEQQADAAEQRRLEADVQRLMAEANATLDEDPDLPILLVLEAYDRQQRTGEEPPGSLVATMQTAVQNSRILHRFDDVTPGVTGLSPDGRTMAVRAADEPATAVVLDVESGTELGRIDTGSAIWSLYIDPSGERLGTVHGDYASPEAEFAPIHDRGHVRIHDLSTFEVLGRTGSARSFFAFLHFSPDWRYVAAVDVDGGWRLGDVPRRSFLWDLGHLDRRPVEHASVNIGGWLPDGETLVVHDDETIRFVDPLTGDDLRPPLDVGTVYSVGVHPEREELVVVGDDLELWRPDATAPFRVLADAAFVGRNAVGSFTPDGSRIVLKGVDDEVRIIEPDTGSTLVLLGNPIAEEVSMSADGTRLLVGDDTGSTLWDLTPAGPSALGNLPTEGEISQLAFDRAGSTAVVAERGLGPEGSRARVRRFDLGTGAVLESSGDFDAADVVASTEGWYGYAPRSGPARVGHLDDEEVDVELDRCDVPRAIDDQGRWMLVAVDDQRCDVSSARVVDPSTGEVLLELRNHHAHSDGAEFGPSGTIAAGLLAYRASDAFGNNLNGIVLRRVFPTDEILGLLLEDNAWDPQFSADGRHLSIGSSESGAFVIDVEQVLAGDSMSDAIVANPRGDGGPTTFPLVGGGSLVMGQSGDVLRFHGLETGTEWMTLPVDSDVHTRLRITADDRYLYYESAGGVLRRFPLDHRELAELARDRVHRDFTEAECLRFTIADDCSVYAVG